MSAAANDLARLEARLPCLFVCDGDGRLLAAREPGGLRAPRFWLGRTRLGNLWRFRDDVPAATVRELSRWAAKEAPLFASYAVPPPPERLEPIRRALEEDAPITTSWRGPAFAFPSDPPAELPAPGGRVRLLEPTDVVLVEPGFSWLAPELAARAPVAAVVEAGAAVSICFCARRLDEGPGAPVAEAGVETLASHRGRGLGAAVVAAWARALMDCGGTPFYSTSWENTPSRALASRLGLELYAEDLHLT